MGSDYGFEGEKIFPQSSFGGLFPEDLGGDFFPWRNFFGGTQHDYLAKEEAIAGAHGIEARYPFLDVQVVQEFLWLSKDIKNSDYKAPLVNFMRKEAYPFVEGKTGFNPETPYATGATGDEPTVMRIGLHKAGICPPPTVPNAAEVCPDGASHEERGCPVQCRNGFLLERNTLQCTITGGWAGSAACSADPSLARRCQVVSRTGHCH